ncbi:hypothetical protein WNY37_09925 [Henriciella sp. AS95]|uniref:hypothetical protein n=1 Tax=Henriciella sp. AS95 TaxID=3135782 RepID=UPI0031718D90
MRNHIVFLFTALIVLGAILAYREYNPEPPADYEIYYFGSTKCGVCKEWKSGAFADWKHDDAFRYAPIKMVEVTPSLGRNSGDYFRYNDVYQRAFGGQRSTIWPSFVLLNGDEVEVKTSGLAGWQKIEKRVRNEAHRVRHQTEAGRLCLSRSESPKCV